MQQREDLAHGTLLPLGGLDRENEEGPRPGTMRTSGILCESSLVQGFFDDDLVGSRYVQDNSFEREGQVTTDPNFNAIVGGNGSSMFRDFHVSPGMDVLHAANRNVPQNPGQTVGSAASDTGTKETPTRFLWIGNLTLKATRPMLCTIFERFGLLEDLVAFPGRMYAFVTYQTVESATKALQSIQGAVIKDITGEKGMVIKYRPERKSPAHGSEGSRDGSVGRGSSGPPSDIDVEPSPRIWLGNIAPTATAANLQSVLGRFGHLVDAAVFPARIGPLGYAFVKFERIEDAVNAYNTLNNAVVPALSGTKQVKMRYKPVSEGAPARDTTLDALQASIPSRHIWIGNVTQKPSEDMLIKIFSRFGPIESARVFSAKSYAFVNFYDVGPAIEAITKLDGVSVPVLTGLKPLVMRYQHDSSSMPGSTLNPKMMELLARTRAVPDSQQAFVDGPLQQRGMDAPSDYSLLSNFSFGGGQTSVPIRAEAADTEAARITAMLQNLAAWTPPNSASSHPIGDPGVVDEQHHKIEALRNFASHHMWGQDGKSQWQPSAQDSVAPDAFQSWDLC